MKQFKAFFGLFALVIAATLAFAFTPRKNDRAVVATDAKAPFIWLKYDCSNPGQVQLSGSSNYSTSLGNPPSGIFTACQGGSAVICAVRVDQALTHIVGGNPNIRELNDGEVLPDPETFPNDYVYCEED